MMNDPTICKSRAGMWRTLRKILVQSHFDPNKGSNKRSSKIEPVKFGLGKQVDHPLQVKFHDESNGYSLEVLKRCLDPLHSFQRICFTLFQILLLSNNISSARKTSCTVDASAGTLKLGSYITFIDRFVDGYVYKTGDERVAQVRYQKISLWTVKIWPVLTVKVPALSCTNNDPVLILWYNLNIFYEL